MSNETAQAIEQSVTEATPAAAEKPAAERRLAAENIVKSYVIGSTGFALIPVPLADLAGIMALEVKLVHSLCKHYEVPFKENLGKSLVTSLLSGAGAVVGVVGLGSLAKALPVLGTIGGMASVGISAGAITYAVGQVFISHFEGGGTLSNFDTTKMRALFKREVQKGKEVAKDAEAAGNLGESPSAVAAAN
ncbi:MAG: DUF697 domain-containing protein [Rhodocyclaceae bacterium]|nr:DUF697 domain-containing protein [Rhodocyclaceae bacterium]